MSETDRIDMTAVKRLPTRGVELMLLMTRFEYALKETNYGTNRRNGTVEVNWDKVANELLKSPFFDHVRDEDLAPVILRNPPSRQVVSGQSLDWEEAATPTDIQALIGAVRRVRNNLVHGGKSGDKDSDRNELLVAEAIQILTEVLKKHADLRYAFEGKW